MLRNRNVILVSLFAIAMAYLESAVVVYLRAMYGIEDLLRDINFETDIYTFIEIGREAATIVMLVIIGLIAGNTWPKKIGYFFLSFGVWDIFYYIWLYVFIQWPKSLFEWDILFLIPLPWWGPVITPVLISLLLILIGYLLISEVKFKVASIDWVLFILSIIVLLYTFTEDSVSAIISETGDLAQIRPTTFNWIIFLIAYAVWVLTTLKVFYPRGKQ
jgi:hypothetical protein